MPAPAGVWTTLVARLDDILSARVRRIEVLLPYDKLALADILRSRGNVLTEEYRADGVYYAATARIDDLHHFEPYFLEQTTAPEQPE